MLIISKKSIVYKKKENSKPLKRSKILDIYESLILNNYNNTFIENNSKNKLEKRTLILIRNVSIVEPPFFIFSKNLLKIRKIYNKFKFIKDYKKYIDIFFQYKIIEYKNNRFTNVDLQKLVYNDFINIDKEYLKYI